MKDLNTRQVSAVLAGLRLLQHWMEQTEPNNQGVMDILENDGDFDAMDVNEIDDLCEQLNTRTVE